MAAASVATPSSSTAISSSDSTAAGAKNYFINLILIGLNSLLTVAASLRFFFGT
jgi:hypothetical protein